MQKSHTKISDPPGGMVGRASSWKLSANVFGEDNADENSLSLEMYDAKLKTRRVSARRKIRSRSKPTSTHATEDNDIESQVRAFQESILPQT